MAHIRARKRKDGGTSWTVRVRIHDGKKLIHQESRTFSDKKYTRRHAVKWGQRREIELEDKGVGSVNDLVTIGALIDRYVSEFGEHGAWGKTKQNDLLGIKKTSLAQRPAIGVTSAQLVDHIRQRRNAGAGPATAGNDLIWLGVIYKLAPVIWNVPLLIDTINNAKDACRATKLTARAKQRSRRPSLEELNQIMTWLDSRDGRSQTPMVDIVLFSIFSARRESETCRITWKDYNPKKPSVIVRDMKDPRQKKGNDVEVILTEEAAAIVDRQVRTDDARIFPYNPKTVGSAFTRSMHTLEIEDLRFHDLRHEATSRLFELQLDIPQVAQITGHRSWQNLRRYTHLKENGYFDKFKDWQWLPATRK